MKEPNLHFTIFPRNMLVKSGRIGYNTVCRGMIVSAARRTGKETEKMSENEFNNDFSNEEDLEMEEDLVVFETEDGGEEITFVIEDYFFYNGEEYAILTEYDTEKEMIVDEGSIVCKIETSEDENGEEIEEFVPVEDDEMAEKLIEIANAQLAEDDEEE